jgi:hypothetical protein
MNYEDGELPGEDAPAPFGWTELRSQTATRGTYREGEWTDFLDYLRNAPVLPPKVGEKDPHQRDRPMAKLGRFADDSAAEGSPLLFATGVEADYDDGEMSPQEAAERLKRAGVLSVVATTRSHTEEAPAWRVFAPLRRPVATKAERTDCLARIVDALGLPPKGVDSVSAVLKQRFYTARTPGGLILPVEGWRYVDDLPPVVAPAVQPPASGVQPLQRDPTDTRVEGWVQRIAAGEEVNTSVRDLAAHLQAVGTPEATARGIFQGLRPQVAAARGEDRARKYDAEWPRLWTSAAQYAPPKAGEPEEPEELTPDVGPDLDWMMSPPAVVGPPPGSVPLPEDWVLLGRALRGEPQSKMGEETVNDSAGTLPPGLHVVAGHTGGGKTAFAIGLARAALKAGHPVVYLSLELSRREIVARLVALEAHELHPGKDRKAPIPWSVLAHGGARTPEQDRKVGEAIQAVRGYSSGLRVWAPDGLPADCDQLREIVRACDVTPLVVIDYLQAPGLQAGGGRDLNKPLRERLGAVIMALRHVSKANGDSWPGCPVLVLSTTARSNVKGAEGTPGMSGGDPDELRRADLEALKALPKEAGEIEATAVTSWAWAYASPEDDPERPRGGAARVTLRLAKSRGGLAGQWVPLTFYGPSGRLVDARGRYDAAEEADQKRKKEREARQGRAKGDN